MELNLIIIKKIRNDTLTPELFEEIKEGIGICFDRFFVYTPSRYELAQRYINMTNNTLSE